MTSNQGGGTHPGDPWSPDWQPATKEETPEEEWPYDESLTLSDAELEIAGLDDEEEVVLEEAEQPGTESDAAAREDEEAAEAAEAAAREAEEAAAREAEEAAAREAEEAAEAAAREAEEAAAREAEEAAAREAEEAAEAAAREAEAAAEVAAREAEEAAAREAEEAAEVAAREAEEAAAREAEAAAEVAAREAEEAAAREAEAAEVAAREAEEAAAREAEAAEAAAREAEEAAVREAEAAAEVAAQEAEAAEAAAREAEEAAEVAAREAEESAAREAEEAAEAAAREAEEAAEVAAREAEESAAREAEEAAEAAAREAEEAAVREAEAAAEVAAREAEAAEAAAREAEAAEVAAREAEESAAREAEAAEAAAREAEEAEDGGAAAGEPEVVLRAVGDGDGETDDELVAAPDEIIGGPIEEVAVEDLQAEPEWLEAVEEMTLDDIAEEGERAAPPMAVVEVQAGEPAEVETPTDVIDSLAAAAVDEDEPGGMIIEDATFEVVDVDDADLRADTAEHLFEALSFEAEQVDTGIDHDQITAEVPETAEAMPPLEPIEPPTAEEIEFEVPAEYELVVADVDETRAALAAFMAPAPDVEPIAADQVGVGEGWPERALPAEGGEQLVDAKAAGGQLRIPTEADPAPSMADEAAEPVEPGPLTPEEELIARLSDDLVLPDFETFVQEDFSRDFVPEPTQEHRGLAETISTGEAPEPSALAATMPGVDHGHVGFQEFDEDLHFDDPDAVEVEEESVSDGEVADGAEPYASDLTLRVASAVILVAVLAATLWAGGLVFLLFITVIAVAAQIEFYTAARAGGYRPMVLFGLLGGLGALVGTYVQGSEVLREGPVAVAAALGLTVVATFAWYGSQESPPSDPWRNGVVTILGVAWIPALLALVLPMAAAPRSDRFQIIIVLLIAVAAFDVGSYFVGRAVGSRKLSPLLSPNKTVEGLIGGIIATLVVALVAAAAVGVFDAGNALAIAAGIIIASPLGDLAESLMKRSLGIKDMGQLIPGHGGVLDRIDSYLFAVPIAYVVLRWTGLL